MTPLSTLLSHALVAFTIELRVEAVDGGEVGDDDGPLHSLLSRVLLAITIAFERTSETVASVARQRGAST